jgi:hypothetical protein
MPELIRNTEEESSVSSDSENTEPSDEEIGKYCIESLGLKKKFYVCHVRIQET